MKPSLIGDGLHCLLKVIPMCYKQSDSYHTYEFEHNEFLAIATSEVQFLDFELRSYSGALVDFAGENIDTFLNLTFEK